MATPETIARKIEKRISEAVDGFGKSVPSHQQSVLDEIEMLLKDLDVKNGRIEQSIANLKLIGRIKEKLRKLIAGNEWKSAVKDYAATFDEIGKLQNEYFTAIVGKFKPPAILSEIRSQTIDATLVSLTGSGLDAAITERLQTILRTNITTGASYTKLMKQVRSFLTTDETGAGAMERYTKQITTDALNQYSRQYVNTVSSDLGLEWYKYTGAIIEGSRAFCRALVKKKFIHVSEIPNILKGDFKEFEDEDGEINEKTGLPDGMIAGTTPENFYVYAGGYQCGHHLNPITASQVPLQIIRSIPRSKLGRESITVLNGK